MGSYLLKSVYREYLAALRDLAEAQNKAREFGALLPLKSKGKVRELPSDGKEAYQRLVQASEVYAIKYKAWRDSLKTYGL
jgi:hypothetical protein